MAASRSVRLLGVCILAVVWCYAQQLPQHSSQPDKVLLEEASSALVSSVPAESIAMPVLCDADGNILLRLAMPDTGVEDPVSVSGDGKTVTRFGKEKINDIPRPLPLSMFLSGSEVYILTRGSISLNSDVKWRKPNGEVETDPASKSTSFVARFRRDGTYVGAVPLDLSFKPLHLGVFENGDFLVAGYDPPTDEPRVAIVGSNGQFRKFVELKGDVHARVESDASAREKNDPTALPRSKTWEGFAESLRDVVSTSQIATDGPNLLLFRPVNAPVFSISPSGDVRVHNLQVKGDYRLFTIKATRDSWIVEFIYDLPDRTAQKFATYAFDPGTGAPLREYFFPTDLGFGLACADGDKFTFVMANIEGKTLELMKLRPANLP
jgi:hypothetical protein